MRLNDDLRARVHVASEEMAWAPSPLPGVERRMLERIGGETARATSIVRYAPRSFFSPHVHDGGEEFFVLDGVFSDEHGDYPAGMYVRNPPGSKHKPHSEAGCTIFVKLWQMYPDDQEYVRIDTTCEELWCPGPASGVQHLPLYARPDEKVVMLRLARGASLPERTISGGEEILVVDGSLRDRSGRYAKGSWLRSFEGSADAMVSDTGCRLYVKTGHLAKPPPLPAGAG